MSNRIELEKGFEIDSEYEKILDRIKEKELPYRDIAKKYYDEIK